MGGVPLGRPAVALDPGPVAGLEVRVGGARRQVEIDPRLALHGHDVVAAEVGVEVERNVGIGLDVGVARGPDVRVDDDLPIPPQEPDRGALRLAVGVDRREPADLLGRQALRGPPRRPRWPDRACASCPPPSRQVAARTSSRNASERASRSRAPRTNSRRAASVSRSTAGARRSAAIASMSSRW